jgi:transcription antitermination factor NusG
LKHRVDTLGLKDKVFDVIVPKENQIEIKNGKRRVGVSGFHSRPSNKLVN